MGYLRDIRRLTVALSRARLGLYILGRRSVFEACNEVREAFVHLFERSNQLMVTTGEMFPTSRLMEKEVEATEMAGVEHLGQYVFEMTKAMVESLKAGGKQLPAMEETPEMMRVDEVDEEDEGEGTVEDEVQTGGDEEMAEDLDGVT